MNTSCEELPVRTRVAKASKRVSPRDGDAMPATSSIYECRVLHQRFAPREHRFVYRLFYLCLDLDELPALSRRVSLFSVNRPNLFSLHEQDFLPIDERLHGRAESPLLENQPPAVNGAARLKDRVLAFCAAHGVVLASDAQVRLVALPRLFGYQFNPVAFYFCADRDGTPRAAIAEVTNTFREVKPYFVPLQISGDASPGFRLRVPKHFYVSPFSSVDVEFDFRLRVPDAKLAVQIDDYDAGSRVLHSTLTGERVKLSTGRLAGFVFKYPFVTLGVVARIHWQALRLWLKRVPFFRKADAAVRQRDLYRPHPSISNRRSS